MGGESWKGEKYSILFFCRFFPIWGYFCVLLFAFVCVLCCVVLCCVVLCCVVLCCVVLCCAVCCVKLNERETHHLAYVTTPREEENEGGGGDNKEGMRRGVCVCVCVRACVRFVLWGRVTLYFLIFVLLGERSWYSLVLCVWFYIFFFAGCVGGGASETGS